MSVSSGDLADALSSATDVWDGLDDEQKSEVMDIVFDVMKDIRPSKLDSGGTATKSEFQVVGRASLIAWAVAIEVAGLTLDSTVVGAAPGVILNVMGLVVGYLGVRANKMTPEKTVEFSNWLNQNFPRLFEAFCKYPGKIMGITESKFEKLTFYTLAACPAGDFEASGSTGMLSLAGIAEIPSTIYEGIELDSLMPPPVSEKEAKKDSAKKLLFGGVVVSGIVTLLKGLF